MPAKVDRGWAAIALLVLAYDLWAVRAGTPTLSTAFRTANRRLTIAATVYVVAHLFGIIPSRFDPLSRLGGSIRRPQGVV